MADGSVEIEVKLTKDQLTQALKSMEGDINDTVSNSKSKLDSLSESFTKIGHSMTSVGKNLTTHLTAPIVAVGTLGVTYNSQLEQSEKALTTLTGSAEEAQRIMAQIKEDAKKTPFDVKGLTRAEQLLISTGISAKDSRATILALGDAISATGGGNEELSRMAVNLQQIKNVGKASALDIKQFALAGVDIYGLLADYTGKTREEVSKLEVSYEDLSGALQYASKEGGKYFGAMEAQSQTTAGKISNLKDSFNEFTGELTKQFVPIVKNIIDTLNQWLAKFSQLDDRTKKTIGTVLILVAGLGPVLIILGKVVTAIGAILGAVKAVKTAIAGIKIAKIVSGIGAIKTALTALSGPVGIAIAGLTAVTVAIIKMKNENARAEQEMRTNVENWSNSIGESMSNYRNQISSATSLLSQFGDNMFITGERQAQISNDIETYQNKITATIQKAINTRGYLTDQEKAKIEGFVQRIKELTDEQIDAENSRADAINTRAKMISDSYEGSLEGYMNVASQWIKTAEEQRDKTIAIADERLTSQITTLNQEYSGWSEEEKKADSHYQEMLSQYQDDYDNAVLLANQKFGETNAIFTNGMTERGQSYENFAGHFKYWEDQIKKNTEKHAKDIEAIEKNRNLSALDKEIALDRIYKQMQIDTRNSLNGMTQNMNEAQRNQFSFWLKMSLDAGTYGGKLSAETKSTMTQIGNTINHLPQETRGTFTNVMNTAISEVENKRGALTSKAQSVANSFTSTWRKWFRIGSPSKWAIETFGYIMEGAEIGLDQKKKSLYDDTAKIAKGVLDRFSFDGLSSRLSDAVALENNKMSASLNNSFSRNFTANISLDGSVEMDKKKVGRLVAPSVQRTFREAGAYVN